MTATDELRAMLDEWGVEWASNAIQLSDVTATFWIDCNGNVCSAVGGMSDLSYSMLSVQANFTPAQAIAATLSDTDATTTRQSDAETCHIVKTWTESDYAEHWRYSCSECGHQIEVGERDIATGNPVSHANFCWNCGRRVVDE